MTPDPALVQAARDILIDYSDCACPPCLNGEGWGCLPDRIAAFGAAQRAEFEPVVQLLSEALGKYAYPGLTPEWAARAHGALLALRTARPEGSR